MTNTITVTKRTVWGDLRVVIGKMDITSYTTDGESITGALLGLTGVHSIAVWSKEKGYMFRWDSTNSKILSYTAAATQATATTDCGEVGFLALGY